MILLLLIFLFLPVFGWQATCQLSETEQGRVYMVCYLPNDPVVPPDTPILDQDKCLALRDQVIQVLLEAQGSVDDALDSYKNVMDIIQNCVNISNGVFQEFPNTRPYWPDDQQYQAQYEEVYNLKVNTEEAYSTLVQNKVTMEQASESLQNAVDEASSVSCPPNQECSGSGSGSVECPCQLQWNTQLELMHQLVGMTSGILTNAVIIADSAQNVASQCVDIVDCVSSITNRLNSPDDRMWDELSQLYTNLLMQSSFLMTNRFDLTETIYHMRQLIRGDVGDSPLQFTTEGIVSFYNSLLNTASLSLQSLQARQTERMLFGLTNTVERLYKLFNSTYNYNYGVGALPSLSRYTFLYDIFTNTHLRANTRFQRLTQPAFGSSTNWFQRMELYQQAQLGWFDSDDTLIQEDRLQNSTADDIEHALSYTTNGLSQSVEAISNVYLSISSPVSSVLDSFKPIEITAFLPSQITIFPSVEIGQSEFGPVVFESQNIKEYCDTVRDVTSLVWRLSFWVLYILVGVVICRVLFVVVLFIIHFIQNL